MLRDMVTRSPAAERSGVLDFVEGGTDYCENFGLQWRRFRGLQVDSESGSDESRRRFFAETGWSPDEVSGKLLLDAGCGAGRFADVALAHGAHVVAVDLSEAVYACAETLQKYPKDRYLIVRASIFDLPLSESVFDGVYSLGVLQHTPDPLGAIPVLARYLKPGGRLATWIYEQGARQFGPLVPRMWIRRVVSGWSTDRKLRLSQTLTAAFFPMGWVLSWLGGLGRRATDLLPYAARHQQGRGDLRRQWLYSVMDTLDWYGPSYELPQRAEDVLGAMRAAGLRDARRLAAPGMAIVGERA